VILRRTLEQFGVWPQKITISRLTGIPVRTVSRALDGDSLSIKTMRRFTDAYGCTLDDMFEPIPDDDEGASSLRSVK